MEPKLTDQAVSDLPLAAGRAELLEEIMQTPALDHADDTARRTGDGPDQGARRSRRWLVPLAAAASVAALATAPAWWPDDDTVTPVPQSQPAAPASGYLAVLDDPAWEVDDVSGATASAGSISYANGSQQLEISWSEAASYADYVADREHISDPPAPGEPVEVLGADGQLWAYSAEDHTVIREVEDRHWMEFRGSGMDRAAYLVLLGELRLVDEAGFEAALPEEFVVTGERGEAVQAILDGIDEVADPLFPPGSDPTIDSEESDPYHLGADVSGAVACLWLDELAAAIEAGQERRVDRAADVLASSHEWPVLLEMDEEGDYPEVLWELADQAGRGEVPEGYEGALGCW